MAVTAADDGSGLDGTYKGKLGTDFALSFIVNRRTSSPATRLPAARYGEGDSRRGRRMHGTG